MVSRVSDHTVSPSSANPIAVAPPNPRSLAADIGITVLTAGVLVGGALALSQSANGTIKHMGSMLSDGLGLFFGPVLLLALLERITSPAGPPKSVHSWLLNFRINILFYVAAMLTGMLTTTLAAALGHYFHLGLIDLNSAAGKSVIVLMGAVLLSMLIGDFFYYWWHRLSHRPFLWQSHKLHHMDPNLDVLTNMRDSWGDALSTVFIQNLPIAILFKLDSLQAVETGGLLGIILGSYSYFFHTNIRLQYGKAGVVIVGPQWHRIHHSRLPEHRDKNFAAMFPLWDILFGTNYYPACGEFPPTGVDGEKEVQSLREATTFALREWLKMYRTRRARRNVIPV